MGLEKSTVQGLAISGAISLMMSLRKPRAANRGILDASDPPILTKRGATVPFLIGMDVLPGMLCWEGASRVVLEEFSGGAGGKGVGAGGGGKNEVIYSQGHQIICVGPGCRLDYIEQDGRIIWPLRGQHPDGISPASTASGDGFTCRNAENGGSEGSFRIYWGEIDQPVDPLFADGTAKGHATNDAFVMSAVWDDKRTGGSRRWPVIKYGVSVMPYSSQMLYNSGTSWDPDLITPEMNGSSSWVEGFRVGDPNKEHLIRNVVNAANTTISLCGDVTTDFVAGDFCELRGTQADGSYEIISSSLVPGGLVNPLGDDVQEVTTPLSVGASSVTTSGPITRPAASTAPVTFPNLPGGEVVDFLTVMGNVIEHETSTGTGVVTIPPDPSGATVPRNAGAANRMGDGVHQITIYLRRGATAGGYFFALGFETSAGDALATFYQTASGASITPISNDTGITTPSVVTTTNYHKIVVRYSVGADANLDVGDEYDVVIHAIGTGAFAPNAAFLMPFVTVAEEPYVGFSIYDDCSVNHTNVELDSTGLALNAYEGTALPVTLVDGAVAGANAAHLIHQLITTPRPHGVGDLSTLFDLTSLETLGALFETELLRSHYILTSGNKHENILSRLLYEIGVNVQWDAATGLWRFEALRTDTADFTLPGQMILDADVDEFSQSGSSAPKTIMYAFRDSERNFSDEPLTIREDGSPENVLASVRQKAMLDSARDIQTATDIARRIYLIESTKPTVRTVGLCRDAASMRVGDVLDTDGYLSDLPLMVKDLSARPGERVVTTTLVSTPFVTVANQSNLVVENPPPPVNSSVDRDVAQRVFELSGYLSEGVRYLGLRVSGSTKVSNASAHFSRDGVSYQSIGSLQPVTGGVVLDENFTTTFDAYDSWGQENTSPLITTVGPTLRVLDPNFPSRVRNLSTAEFEAGDQWLIVGNEVMFVQRFIAISDGVWRAENVIRGRFEHGTEDNISGLQAFVVHADSLPVLNLEATVGETESIKISESLDDRFTPLADAVDLPLNAVGNAVRPPHLSNLQIAGGFFFWHPALTVSLSWDYANNESMRLSQAAGVLSEAGGLHQGVFTITVKDVASLTTVMTLEGSRDGTLDIPGSDIETALTNAGKPSNSTIRVSLTSVGNSGLNSAPKGTTQLDLAWGI